MAYPPVPMSRGKLKSPAEMEAIREKEATIQEAARKKLVPEANEAKPVAYIVLDRYVKGNFRGMFCVSQMITEDAKGQPLKKPVKVKIIDGVDIVVAMAYIETTIRRRVFR